MRWRGERESENVEDRRGIGRGGMAIGGGLGGLVLVLLALLLGADPRQFLQQSPTGDGSTGTQTSRQVDPRQEESKHFSSVVLASTEDVWTDIFQQNGSQYRKPTLVLFTDQVESACGLADVAVGPFYCPGDQKLYLDLGFFDELQTRFQAPGDFAQAYVIAHEVGHHVQRLLGTMDRVDAMRGRVSEADRSEFSIASRY
jgi:predicted metalloprotease